MEKVLFILGCKITSCMFASTCFVAFYTYVWVFGTVVLNWDGIFVPHFSVTVVSDGYCLCCVLGLIGLIHFDY